MCRFPNRDGLGGRRGALVGDLGLKPGDDLHVVAAMSTCNGVVMEERRGKAVARMRARALRFPAGCAFEVDEADARRSAALF